MFSGPLCPTCLIVRFHGQLYLCGSLSHIYIEAGSVKLKDCRPGTKTSLSLKRGRLQAHRVLLYESLMRNVLVHGVRPIYLESSQIHTEHCGQQDNPIHTLPLWYSEFCEVERRALRGFYLNVGLFNVLYWYSRKCDKCISYRSDVCLDTKGVW